MEIPKQDLNHSNANSNSRSGFKAFECQFQPFRMDSKHLMQIPPFERYLKHSNANSNHLNEFRSIQMQIPSIQTGFEPFECKFEPFERDSNHLNANSNRDSNGKFDSKCKFQPIRSTGFEPSIRTFGFQMPISTI